MPDVRPLKKASGKAHTEGIANADNTVLGGLTLNSSFIYKAESTLTQNSTTPSVANGNLFVTDNIATTAYTNFTSGTDGQRIQIRIGEAPSQSSFVHGATIKFVDGADHAAESISVWEFELRGSVWYHVSGAPDLRITVPRDASALVFGDGSDGGVTVSINTTLTRDMYYDSLTVNNGITLSSEGFRIFVRGTLTCTGTIENGGDAGAGGIGGSPGGLGTMGGGGGGGSPFGGSGTSVSPALGGNGGAGSTGGSGGTATVPSTNNGGTQVVKAMPQTTKVRDLANNLLYGGGGGGAGSSTGGGGGGGGIVMIAARKLIGAGSIHANGGAGQSGAGSGNGGGGGGGGAVIVVYNHYDTSASNILISASGGAAGAIDSAAGSAGTVLTVSNTILG